MIINHCDYLNKNLQTIFNNLGINWENNKGIIASHGDKCESSKFIFESNGIPFVHGAVMYLLTYISPYNNFVRNTKHGYVNPINWIIDNYDSFKSVLPDP